jgi:hypothetical protein
MAVFLFIYIRCYLFELTGYQYLYKTEITSGKY